MTDEEEPMTEENNSDEAHARKIRRAELVAKCLAAINTTDKAQTSRNWILGDAAS